MSLEMDVEFKTSFYKKTDSKIVKSCIEETIKELTENAEKQCREICPVDTGLMRDSHSTKTTGLTGQVKNSTDYWFYVVYGTSRQSPQNYPEEVVGNLISDNTAGNIFKKKLKEKGVT